MLYTNIDIINSMVYNAIMRQIVNNQLITSHAVCTRAFFVMPSLYSIVHAVTPLSIMKPPMRAGSNYNVCHLFFSH